MRILLIIDGLAGGGAEKVLLTLAQQFVQMGDQVDLFSLRDVCHYAIPAQINYRLIADHNRRPWRKLTELARRARMLDRAIATAEQCGRFELVLSSLHKTDRIVARSHILSQRNLWFCLHGMFSHTYLAGKTALQRWIKQQKIRRVYQWRNIVTVSDAVAEDLQQCCKVTPANIHTLYNPFDFAAIRQLATQPCQMAGQDYLLHVGRFHKVKRHDRLLEAYALSGINAPLVLLGTGSVSQQAALQALARQLGIADRVLFKGFQANPLPWIRHARLLVLSSDSEGFGNVLVEALSVNTAVVSTRCSGGVVEILTGDLAPCLAELTSASLAQTIKHIYYHPPVIDPQLLQRFSCEQVAERYRDLGNRCH